MDKVDIRIWHLPILQTCLYDFVGAIVVSEKWHKTP